MKITKGKIDAQGNVQPDIAIRHSATNRTAASMSDMASDVRHGFKSAVFISGQKRGLTTTIKRELKRRNAIEPVIGHMKSDGLLDRNHLNGADGDAINAILAAAGHNLRLLARWPIILIGETNAVTAIKAATAFTGKQIAPEQNRRGQMPFIPKGVVYG